MIEYANDSVIKLLKQYDMFAKSLRYIVDVSEKNDICNQMTKIIREVLDITNSIYEKKYRDIESRSVYLMDDEKNRLLELINLVNERRVYVNNQLSSNEELTGFSFDVDNILGEDKLEEYKSTVKMIDRYKNNMRLEASLKEEIKNLDVTIQKANQKINNNKNLNHQLEERMIQIVGNALEKLSLFEFKDREKEIDLAYTELGYSLEKAKENAKIARRDCSEDVILECDNILASTTLDYERYKEKKLILKLIYIYKNPVKDYDELLSKREEINTIFMNITDSELYSMIGDEINKEYSTIKLEAQDMATLKSLMEEKELKLQNLNQARNELDSDSVRGLLSVLLENEKKHQEMIEEENRRREEERVRQEKLRKRKELEEKLKRQKILEEERNKEIELRTKQLLDEKRSSLLVGKKDERKDVVVKPKVKSKEASTLGQVRRPVSVSSKDSVPVRKNVAPVQDDFFTKLNKAPKVQDGGIPVVKKNQVVGEKKAVTSSDKIFPDIPIQKKDEIFPSTSDVKNRSSFFDENEFNDLSDYTEDKKKKSWF